MATLVYAVSIGHLIWLMWSILPKVHDTVIEKCAGYYQCQKYIRTTRFGYPVDLSDSQWYQFRYHLWWLSILLFASVCCRFVMTRLGLTSIKNISSYSFLCGLIGLFIFHGYQALVVLIIVLYGFSISKMTYKLPGNVAYAWPWIYGIFILFLKDAHFLRSMYPRSWLFIFVFESKYSRLYPWQVSCNFLILRYISFCIDRVNCYRAKQMEPACSQRKRSDSRRNLVSSADPSLLNETTSPDRLTNSRMRLRMRYYAREYYLSYMLYLPLYIAGPVIQYDDYMKQRLAVDDSKKVDDPSKVSDKDDSRNKNNISIHKSSVYDLLKYGCIWLGCLVSMEILYNRIPALAIISANLLPHLSVVEIVVVSYAALKLIWLKFMIIWRFFRFWAMCDSITPPENISSLLWKNYNLEYFWRTWHSSFHLWIEKYIFVPLGGWNYRAYSILLVFLFLALWNNFDSYTLVLAFLNASLYGVEMITAQSKPKKESNFNYTTYILGGAVYTHILLFINLLGHTIGPTSLMLIQERLMAREGLKSCFYILYFYYWAAQLKPLT